MYDPRLRAKLRDSLRDVCETMRAQQRDVEHAIREFRQCSQQSKKTLATSYRTLGRINQSLEERRRA